MHEGRRWHAGLLACALLAPALAAQGDEGIQAELQELRREVQTLKNRLDAPDAKLGKTGFLSFLGEHINVKGLLEFEFWTAGSENKPLYPGVGRLRGTDFRIDSLILKTDVDFIKDVYLRTEIELQGGSEEKDPAAGDDLLIDLNEAYFSFDNVIQHLGDLDDPLHTFIRFGAMRPWQYEMFPRSTETYGLPQTAFYRDYRVGIQVGGEIKEGLFYRATVDDGNQLQIVHAGDNNLGYAPVMQDDESNQGPNNHKDIEFALGWRGEAATDFSLRTGAWFRMGRLDDADQAALADSRMGLGSLDGSHRKRRLGWIGAAAYTTDDWVGALQLEWHRAWDANLDREAYAVQPSLKLLFDGTLYQDRNFFSSLELLYRFSHLRVMGDAPTRTSVPDTALAGADRWMHTLAAILEVTKNVKVSAEYTFFQESTWRSVDNDEFLIHLGIGF